MQKHFQWGCKENRYNYQPKKKGGVKSVQATKSQCLLEFDEDWHQKTEVTFVSILIIK